MVWKIEENFIYTKEPECLLQIRIYYSQDTSQSMKYHITQYNVKPTPSRIKTIAYIIENPQIVMHLYVK